MVQNMRRVFPEIAFVTSMTLDFEDVRVVCGLNKRTSEHFRSTSNFTSLLVAGHSDAGDTGGRQSGYGSL